MRNVLIAILVSGIGAVNAASWSRISPEEIRFDGYFDENSYAEYTAISKSGFSRIRITSEGGSPNIALLVAADVQSRGASVIVERYCFSACANYVLLAVRRPVVECGAVVAGHGSPAGMRDVDGLRADGWPEELVREIADWDADFIRREQELLSRSGVRYEFLEYATQAVERAGFKPSESHGFNRLTGSMTHTVEASSWFPTTKALRKYGVDTSDFCPDYDRQIKANMERLGVKGAVSDGE
jgi:hypothetical protein